MNERIAEALGLARDTRDLRLGDEVLAQCGEVFGGCFGGAAAVVVADENTFAAAGRRVLDGLRAGGVSAGEPFIFSGPDLYAAFERVEELQKHLESSAAVPVAVGSGTINDITKLAAHRCGRAYMAVATAASMDGYTAYGASITQDGSKQTFFCPAPRAVVADLEVIGAAPAELNAAGYGDLIAKVPAGADWMLADTLGIEPMEAQAWRLVQGALREWIADPEGVRRGERGAMRALIEGLLMTGLAMQYCQSSRPASGAEHQFSHLWDMQQHRHLGRTPWHGCKVAIGTMAATMLYEQLMAEGMEDLDVEGVCADWPGEEQIEELVQGMHEEPELRRVALGEMRAKYITRENLRARLVRLRREWPGLRRRLGEQLVPVRELREMLRAAGAPDEPGRIGISVEQLKRSYLQAQQIRRRYTVLDLANQTGRLGECVERMFGEGGVGGGAE